MGVVFAVVLAMVCGFVGFVFICIGFITRRKSKIACVVSFVLSGVMLIPTLGLIVILSCGVYYRYSQKVDMENRDGKIFAEYYYGSIEKTRKAIIASDNVNVTNEWGQTPAHLICKNGSEYFVLLEALAEKHADFNIKDSQGRTPLVEAASSFRASYEIVTFLLEQNVDVNVQDNDGFTALMWCASNSKFADEGIFDVVDLLLKNGARLDLKNNSNETAASIVQRLIDEDKSADREIPFTESDKYRIYVELLERFTESK